MRVQQCPSVKQTPLTIGGERRSSQAARTEPGAGLTA
ncbi:hypothetical protein SUDANB58_02915 [Streptomyces sp. enrichment culture]